MNFGFRITDFGEHFIFLPFKGRSKVGMGPHRTISNPILTPALSLKERGLTRAFPE